MHQQNLVDMCQDLFSLLLLLQQHRSFHRGPCSSSCCCCCLSSSSSSSRSKRCAYSGCRHASFVNDEFSLCVCALPIRMMTNQTMHHSDQLCDCWRFFVVEKLKKFISIYLFLYLIVAVAGKKKEIASQPIHRRIHTVQTFSTGTSVLSTVQVLLPTYSECKTVL